MSTRATNFLSFTPPQGVIKRINGSDLSHISSLLISFTKNTHLQHQRESSRLRRCVQAFRPSRSFVQLRKTFLSFKVQIPTHSSISTQPKKQKNFFYAIENLEILVLQNKFQSWITSSTGHGFRFQFSVRLTKFERTFFMQGCE